MILKVAKELPLSGLSRELALLGLSWVVDQVGTEVSNEDFALALENAMETLSNRATVNSSKMGRNDRTSYEKVLRAWFGRSAPNTYTELFGMVVEETVRLIKAGKLDVEKALTFFSVDKKGINLGVPFNGTYAIMPAVVKQPEFYEFQTEFLKPTAGTKAMVNLDPVWLSLIAVGFLTAFAGYIGGRYYLMTKPGMETLFPYVGNVLDGVLLLTDANMKSGARIDSEELYELRLAMKLAEEGKNVSEETYPLTLHLISLEGNVYTELKTVQLDLRELQGYLSEYVKKVENLSIRGINIMVETNDGSFYPLWVLVDIAETELRKGVSGDNQMLAYIFVKDLYRAINSGNRELLQDSIFRLFRQGRALIEGSAKASGLLVKTLRAFMTEAHMEALL
ncbi:type I-A CRISPR-associated protein Cas8a2/Csx9 [Thermococcus sp. SY098]|uniref:type I-A CRISPR-associated protein Cas8a2/Csx9 n=1 Tax=Thermococcus sp. SY098 TaxID=3111325 RepID=UPI002D77D81F|nr:type I-A CRISPR-associated protein Cas8a2/Csx9 [Thermococcus sp. SY098]WRS52691.1 type I-A CRISPR-associated protein Cas8a2/Csx9 [Thermococcus sp. SY098]